MIKWNGRTVLATEPDLTIESDASSHSWGASCQGTSTGEPWTPLEKKWHINCLELLAVTLALKTFVKNNQGGTISKDVIVLTRDLWMRCLERNIHFQAQYLPGVMSKVADMESRSMKDRSVWKLDHTIFLQINKGPVCNQINQPVPSLLQLVARSICRSNRSLSPGLDNSERFCQPTLEPSTESANKNTESRGRSNSGRPSMEISAMVSPPVITSRLATPATQAGHGNSQSQ